MFLLNPENATGVNGADIQPEEEYFPIHGKFRPLQCRFIFTEAPPDGPNRRT
jgi:hypothetical protein